MELKYGLKGKDRQPLIKAIEDSTGVKAVYLKTPSMSYRIGVFNISKDGTVTCSSEENLDDLKNMLDADYGISLPVCACDGTQCFSVEFPKDKADVVKLRKILDNKGDLIKKALGVNSLNINEEDDKLIFPWFEQANQPGLVSYAKFINSLCKMSVEIKRVNNSKHKQVNDKYAFRCFLLRLGFIGDEFKQDRKIMLSRLEGSCAFRNGGERNAVCE